MPETPESVPIHCPLRWAVVGTGAIGSYYGGRLWHGGEDVLFLARSFAAQWQSDGLQVESPGGGFTIPGSRIYEAPRAIGPVDVVLIAAKATANPHLPALIRPLLAPHTVLLTLQNGMGNDEFLASEFPGHTVLGALCFVCINRGDDGVVRHLGEGHVSLGQFKSPPDADCLEIARRMSATGIEVKTVADLEAAQWRKLAWNIPFNGLAIAMGGLDCARLLDHPDGPPRALELMREVLAAAAARGRPLPADLPEKLIAGTREMGPYQPSSLLDFLARRPVETDAIWRIPIRRAAAASIPMPASTRLLAEIESALMLAAVGIAGQAYQ